MVKSQRTLLWRSETGEGRELLREQSVLQLPRNLQILFPLRILLTQLLCVFGQLLLSLLRAVMSRVVDTKPISSPLSSRRDIFVTDIQTLFPEGSIDSSTD